MCPRGLFDASQRCIIGPALTSASQPAQRQPASSAAGRAEAVSQPGLPARRPLTGKAVGLRPRATARAGAAGCSGTGVSKGR
mmetsp:Transcript_78286/g.210657  ORF Transcript_78286/g.210657 Transcript_78286/m.210657 type:complete len:82 (-) Transcript_78286:38-283(-)